MFIIQQLGGNRVRFTHQKVVGGDSRPFWGKKHLHILAVLFGNSFFLDEPLLGDILHPLCGELVQIAPQLGNPLARFRVHLLIDGQAAILLEGQRLQRPLLPVNPEGHLRVIHGVAVLPVGMAQGNNIIGNPLNMKGHKGRPRLQAHTAVLAADDLREQLGKGAVIDLRAGASGLFGFGHSLRRFGNIFPDFGD